MNVRIEVLTGASIKRVINDLARLRVEVFRDYPYLYDGTPDYEESYLRDFVKMRDCVVVAAMDAEKVVGCSTGSALKDQPAEFALPVANAGYNLDEVFYFGESVLDKTFRGRGIGHVFFDRRETHAINRGYSVAIFAAVIPLQNHFMKPVNYEPLDAFWKIRGYRKIEGLTTMFKWKEVGLDGELPHPMQFWMCKFN